MDNSPDTKCKRSRSLYSFKEIELKSQFLKVTNIGSFSDLPGTPRRPHLPLVLGGRIHPLQGFAESRRARPGRRGDRRGLALRQGIHSAAASVGADGSAGPRQHSRRTRAHSQDRQQPTMSRCRCLLVDPPGRSGSTGDSWKVHPGLEPPVPWRRLCAHKHLSQSPSPREPTCALHPAQPPQGVRPLECRHTAATQLARASSAAVAQASPARPPAHRRWAAVLQCAPAPMAE